MDVRKHKLSVATILKAKLNKYINNIYIKYDAAHRL